MGFTNPYPASRLTVDSTNSLVTGMQAWFPLTEGSGSVVDCILHPSHTGTVTNGTWQTGDGGTELSLGGSGSFVTIGDLNLNSANGLTVTAWIDGPSYGNEKQIVTRDNSGVSRHWQFRIDSSGKLNLIRFDSSNTLCANFLGATSLTHNVRYFVAFTFDSSAGSVIYLNGEADGTDSNTTANNSGTGTDILIGARRSSGAIFNSLNAGVQNCKVYDRALSASEIATLYHRPWEGSNYGDIWPYSPPASTAMTLSSDSAASSLMSGCQAWYPLTEGTGTTATCIMGHSAHNGTLDTGVTWETSERGTAAKFDGSNNAKITLGSEPVSGQTISISTWFYSESTSSYQSIYCGTPNTKNYLLYDGNNPRVGWDQYPPSGGGGNSAVNYALRGRWNHVVVTQDATTAKIYVNGELETTFTSEVYTDTATTFYIGYRRPGRAMTGSIQNLRVWDRVLSADEALLLYDRPWEGIEYGDTFHYDPPAPASMLPLTSDSINTDLEAWWAGTDNTGTTLVDISGNSLDATLTGTNDWQNTELGVANLFDNSSSRNSHAETANTQPDLTSAFTWSAWQKIDSAENISSGNRWGCSFVLGDSSGSSDVEIYFNSSSADPNQFPNVVFNRSNGGTVVSANHAKPSNGVVFDEWAHYVIVYDGSDTKSYRNGVLVSTVSISGSPLSTSGKKIFINEFPAYSSLSGLTAHMQNMRLWSRALTADEIWSIYATNPWLGSNYKLASGSTPLYNYIFRTERFRRLG